jgi:rhodanese-related sulfurtransferase
MPMTKRFLAISLLLASCFASCRSTAQVNATLPPAAYQAAIAQGNVQILDVRTADEYRSGHIANSLQADWRDQGQFKDRTQYLDKNKSVYVYCLSGGRSAAAADYLRQQGFAAVTNLEGGMTAWRAAGLPVEGQPDLPAITENAYAGMVSSGKMVLVDFGAPWCPPCKQMEPIVNDFRKAQQGKVTVLNVDGGAQPALMQRQAVAALPTFILYVDGKEVWRKQGVMTLEEMNGTVMRYASKS